jgi:L-rhamnose isomerase
MPWDRLRAVEARLDFSARLTLTEEFRDLPFGAVWAEFCNRQDVPGGLALIGELDAYQTRVAARG